MNTGKQLQQMFIITLLLFLLSGFVKISAQTDISPGFVYGRWGINESPFYVQGDITVPDDSTLTIEPGVPVIFEGYYALNVQGRLLAIGTESGPITFSINDTTGFYKSDTTIGGWNGIQFIDTPPDNDTSKIIFCSIKFGKAVGYSPPDNSGGAIYISNFNKVIISDCIISNNSTASFVSNVGGGISLNFANIILDNNEISYNRAWDGGGIQIWESNPILTNNTISFNDADEGGGGVWIGGLSNCEFNNDNISNNISGGNGGGMICWQTTNTTLNSVTFNNNLANWGGGVGVIDCELQVNDCIFNDNGSLGLAGGLGADFSTVEINNTNFERDTASVFGGAMGIYYSDLTLDNSNLIDNSAGILGGGIHSDFSNLNIINTTFERDTTGESGGGIFIWHCDLTVNDCDFNNNTATYNGGAICSDSSMVMIKNSNFKENLSIWGGGILNNRGEIKLQNCLFIENASDHGGALNIGFSNADLSNVSFVQNSSSLGGGIDAFNSSLQIDSCLFSENEASDYGAGIQYQVDTALYINPYEFELLNSEFTKNSAFYRGAIDIQQLFSETSLVDVKIDKCEFIENTIDRGGNLLIAGFIKDFVISNSIFRGNTAALRTATCQFSNYVSGEIYNCIFNSNNTLNGGAASSIGIGSRVNFINCTFSNNSGGATLTLRNDAHSTLVNNILWKNERSSIIVNAVTDTTPCSLDIYYCDIQYGLDSIVVNDSVSIVGGIGNIDSDPLFADTMNNNFHLQESSPCIAAGIDSLEIAGTWYYCPLTDLEGNPRPNPSGTMPDMGSYESAPVVEIEENVSSIKPGSYSLSQNYPNPFNPNTTFNYSIPVQANVIIRVFDILGNEIETLLNEEKQVGNYAVEFEGSDLTSGIYFYRIQVGAFVETKKMILMK